MAGALGANLCSLDYLCMKVGKRHLDLLRVKEAWILISCMFSVILFWEGHQGGLPTKSVICLSSGGDFKVKENAFLETISFFLSLSLSFLFFLSFFIDVDFQHGVFSLVLVFRLSQLGTVCTHPRTPECLPQVQDSGGDQVWKLKSRYDRFVSPGF